MNVAVKKKSPDELLAEVQRLPENMTGEVVDGELYVMGRPSLAHQTAEGELESELRRGGGSGGQRWIIASELEVLFSTKELVVPDLVGWRRDRIVGHERDNPMTVRPDWVCEILSPSTRLKDLGPKRQLYARHGVPHLWLIDPEAPTLEAFELQHERWSLLGTWVEREVVTGVAPFPDFTFDLSKWWLTPA